jgi:hypothetical protein
MNSKPVDKSVDKSIDRPSDSRTGKRWRDIKRHLMGMKKRRPKKVDYGFIHRTARSSRQQVRRKLFAEACVEMKKLDLPRKARRKIARAKAGREWTGMKG